MMDEWHGAACRTRGKNITERLPLSADPLYDSLIEAMVRRCRHVEGSVVRHEDGLVLALTGQRPASGFCFVREAAPAAAAFAAQLQRAIAAGAASGAPWSLVLRAGCVADDPERQQLLAALSLRRHAVLHGLWAQRPAAPLRPAPDLSFQRVDDEATLALFAALNHRAYGHTGDAALALFRHYLQAPGGRAFLGCVNGLVVTCAAGFPAPAGHYLGGIATAPDERGRGYGEAALRHAWQCLDAEFGPACALLFASARQVPFYGRLGFALDTQLWLYRLEDGDESAHF